jgi:hypothetical protein
MIKKLAIERLIDYKKKDFKDPFYYYSSMLNNIEVDGENRVHTDKVIEKFSRDGADPTITGHLLNTLVGSKWSINIAKSEFIYRQGKTKNYIPSKPLLELFSKMTVDCPATAIPMDYRAYFELDGFLGVGYALVDMSTFEGDRVVRISLSSQDRKSEGWYFGITVKDGENIMESMNRISFHEYDAELFKNFETDISPTQKRRVQTVLNLIIYTTNPNEEFLDEFNKFNSSHNKAQKEKLKYTSKGFTLLGYDAEFLRLIKVEKGFVAPFPRWQPCGPGRKQRKLIIVKAHERTYNKKLSLVQ